MFFPHQKKVQKNNPHLITGAQTIHQAALQGFSAQEDLSRSHLGAESPAELSFWSFLKKNTTHICFVWDIKWYQMSVANVTSYRLYWYSLDICWFPNWRLPRPRRGRSVVAAPCPWKHRAPPARPQQFTFCLLLWSTSRWSRAEVGYPKNSNVWYYVRLPIPKYPKSRNESQQYLNISPHRKLSASWALFLASSVISAKGCTVRFHFPAVIWTKSISCL